MKRKIKKALLNCLLTSRELEKIQSPKIEFPGGIMPINNTHEDDVFIVGYPKSGNTLMQHLISHLVYGFNQEASRTMVNLIVPDIYANSYYFRFNERCYFKSHDLPKPEYKKVIYIMRDGRDALLSFYHMRKNMGKPLHIDDLYSGKVKFRNATWSEHIEHWEKNPFEADILWIKFENLKTNKKEELKRICEFLNISRSETDLEDVMKFTSLEHMRALEKRKDWARMKKVTNFNDGSFVGKGKIKSYTEEVSQDAIKSFEFISEKMLKKHYHL
ncbi:sulfotransferase domain-containing protein [Psychroserpens mesophilus]|uniref:sulfotransferase domain-containing protein n=1 Tax=Psychroserpens mesophilus TaxID=325473 RepID=UPI003D662BB1